MHSLTSTYGFSTVCGCILSCCDGWGADGGPARRAFGVVYEATHKETGRRRAVKTISKAKLVSKEDVADVQREMQVRWSALGMRRTELR